MEQARLFLAIALSIIVFLVWELVFVKQEIPQKPDQRPSSEEVVKKEEPYIAEDELRTEPTPEQGAEPIGDISSSEESLTVVREPRIFTVNTPLYSVKISEKGAVFQSFLLKDYREEAEEDSPLKEMIPQEVKGGTMRTGLADNRIQGLDDAVFSAIIENYTGDLSRLEADVMNQPETVTFSYEAPDGIVVEKTFLFSPDTYMIDMTVTIKNGSDRSVRDSLTVSLANTVPKGGQYSFEGPSALIDNSVQEIKVDDIEDKNRFSGNMSWIAIEDRYFISAVIPASPVKADMRLSVKDNILENCYFYPETVIKPGTQQRFEFEMFLGPKSLNILSGLKRFMLTEAALEQLKADGVPAPIISRLENLTGLKYASQASFESALYERAGKAHIQEYKSLIINHAGGSDYHLDKAIDFGWFDFIAKPCLMLMNFLYGFIPNYGIAIIILTLGIKLILWPLGSKGYKSMNEMKKLQPLITELREKYKDDKRRMNQEMMNLYKTYKINPMGGCLPMILQIPVFIALYRMLYEAIELRHAPFVGWINDLSAPDRLFRFDIAVPLMEPPYGIPVLTVIMGATMLLQQKMSPPPGDPTQAKMMMFMPLIFTVIFINFPSGLVLYWLVNNVLSISQQYYILKKSEK